MRDLQHGEILTSTDAIAYLRLLDVADSPEAAERILHRFVREGRIHPLKWSKSYLYAKSDLDRFVAEEIERLGHDDEHESEATASQQYTVPEPVAGGVYPRKEAG